MKKLFSNPHFNIMDGLDIYIDDYSQPDPLPPGMLESLLHAETLLNPLKHLATPLQRLLDMPGTSEQIIVVDETLLLQDQHNRQTRQDVQNGEQEGSYEAESQVLHATEVPQAASTLSVKGLPSHSPSPADAQSIKKETKPE